MRRANLHRRPAFTLVELLMVITIIGILAGILVPTIMYAMQAVKKRAIGIEVQTLANAVDQYKNKYGDYPPDGTNTTIFQRHFRKLFPQIAASEFTAVAAACNVVNGAPAGVMDPPEALVFALGGYSEDPVHPFTGTGGPISVVPGVTPTSYQYNTDRNEPIYEFKQSQLSITLSGSATLSNDESDFGGTADAMPVYRPSGKMCPFVYFDSRTYSFSAGGGTFFNNYSPGDAFGWARPYKSEKPNTNVSSSPANAEAYYRYMKDREYQIVSAGLDDNYGGVKFASGDNGPVLFTYPSGGNVDMRAWTSSTAPVVGTVSRYDDGDVTKPQLDNVANFADGTLEDALTN
ncbi:MAG: type II secretion system protein [Aureliella sp.]